MKKELPEITISEWLQAEQEVHARKYGAIPKGGCTVAQWAEEVGCSQANARHRLKILFDEGAASREEWNLPSGGTQMVYFLKPKKRHS